MPTPLMDQAKILRDIVSNPSKALSTNLIPISSYQRIDEAIREGRPPVILNSCTKQHKLLVCQLRNL